jgi:hypothetical protein
MVYPDSYTMDTGSFSGVKRPERGVDHPPTSSAEIKETTERCLFSPSEPSRSVRGLNSYFTLTFNFLAFTALL